MLQSTGRTYQAFYLNIPLKYLFGACEQVLNGHGTHESEDNCPESLLACHLVEMSEVS